MEPTPNQRKAIETIDRHLSVDAGAGSGKTYVLVNRIIRILETNPDLRLDQIVAITFTDLAASEMKARLRKAFRAKALEFVDDPQMMTLWRQRERQTDTARVSTIHSFCAAILRQNALRCGIDPDFSVLVDAEGQLLIDTVVRDTVHKLVEESDEDAIRIATEFGLFKLLPYLKNLLGDRGLLAQVAREYPLDDPEALLDYWRANATHYHDLRLNALCRTGTPIRYLAELKSFEGKCANPDNAMEIHRRLMVEALEAVVRHESIPIISARCESVIKHRAGKTAAVDWNQDDFDALMKLRENGVKNFLRTFTNPAASEPASQEAAELSSALYRVHCRVEHAYAQAKTSRNAFDFDDLILRTANLLDSSEGREALERTRQGIKYLLIDEFQDTDSLQYRLAKSIAGFDGKTNGAAKLFIVGDAKQSIYGWRGAEVDVFQDAQRDIKEEPVQLKENFRSTPDVLEFVNDHFEQSGALSAVEANYGRLKAVRPSWNEPRVEFMVVPKIDEHKTADYREVEAQYIARRIIQLVHSEPITIYDDDEEQNRPARFSDVAILLRSRSDIFLYERALQDHNIDYNIESGPGFYDRQEVLDFRNLLKVVVDPLNELSLLAFLRSPIAAINDEDVYRLAQCGGLANAFTRGVVPKDAAEPGLIENAQSLIADLRAESQQFLPQFLRFVLTKTNLEAIYLAQYLGLQKASNLRKVVELADSFAATRMPSLNAFVRYLDEVHAQEIREGEAPLPPDQGGAVRIMTVHKAKGLEFPIVFLADTSRGLGGSRDGRVALHRDTGLIVKPLDDKGESQTMPITECLDALQKFEAYAEHQRLLYVALTRARDYLVVSGASDANDVKRSWLGDFNRQYNLFDRSHGDTVPLATADHSITVTTESVETAPFAVEPDPLPQWNDTAITARIAPIQSGETPRIFIAVTAMANLIAGPTQTESEPEPESDEERDSHARTAPLTRGTAIHEILEQWDMSSDPADLINRVCAVRYPIPAERDEAQTQFQQTIAALRDSGLLSAIAADPGRQLEAPFDLAAGPVIVRGAIDVLLSDGTIIDYKTGRHDPELQAVYETQLRLYAAAVRDLSGIAPKSAHLLYVDGGRTIEVDVSESQINDTLKRANEIAETFA